MSYNRLPLIFWLDADKLDQARKLASEASLVGLKGMVCYTEKDPKEYSDLEISKVLEVFNV